MELELPFEFLVHGVPVSAQTKRSESIRVWQRKIQDTVAAKKDKDNIYNVNEPIGVTIFYYPQYGMQGDIDNIVKPILDALTATVYTDDRLVERVVVQRFDNAVGTSQRTLSHVLTSELDGQRPVVYI